MTSLARALSGIKVLDLSRVLAGPLCTQTLGDLGADVVKVESPIGDETRSWGPPFTVDGQSAYFMAANRNKRSIVLDLNQDREILRKLIAECDVLVENFLPKSMRSFGLTPEEIHAINPRAIVCSISAYGRSSAKADLPGYDFVLQAETGFMATTGESDGQPVKVSVAIVDIVTAQHAVAGILAALIKREKTGTGCVIDLALADCGFAAQVNLAQAWLVSGKLPVRRGNSHLQIVPYQSFAAKDGWLVLAVGNDKQWESFCKASGAEFSGKPEWSTNQTRVENRQAVVTAVASLLATRTVSEWVATLSKASVPCGRIGDYQTFVHDQKIMGRTATRAASSSTGASVELLQSPLVRDGTFTAPPLKGEHQEVVLFEWGIDNV